MKPSPDELRSRMEHLTEGLKRAGVKLTHQRLEVCREIAAAGCHPDAETVFGGVRMRVPTISLDTVYRTLSLLVELGLIEKLSAPHDRMLFDGNIRPHHHFVCLKCGEAFDFYSESFDQLPVPEEVQNMGSVQKVQVELRGVCQACANGSA